MTTIDESTESNVANRDRAPGLMASITAGDPMSFDDIDDDVLDLSTVGQRKVTLHEFEEKNLVMEASISAITWFEGNIQSAARLIRSRLKDIITKNPWMLGRLVRDPEVRPSPLQLVFSEESDPTETDIDELFLFHRIHDVERDYTFSLGMNLQETTKLAQEYGYTVKPAKLLIDQDEPVFKVAIVPDSEKPNQFALITSMSHRVGDGFTFYSLYKMLDPKRPIIALCPERKLDVVSRIEDSMGKKMLEGIGGFWVKMLFARDILLSKVKGAKWAQKIFLLNDTYIKTVKEGTNDGSDSCGNKRRRLSTNDVIVSDCFKVSKPDLGLMSINFRGRIENCYENDAPNYFNTIIYRPPDYASPDLIRESISGKRFKRASKPPTTLLTSSPYLMASNVHVSICTNWATFNDDDFSLGPDFHQILHMPLKDMQYAAPSLISNFTVFKASPGKIAICATGTPEMVESFSKSKLVLSKAADDEIAKYFE